MPGKGARYQASLRLGYLVLKLREGFVMLEFDSDLRAGAELPAAEHFPAADDMNFTGVRDLDGKNQGEADLRALLHAITRPQQSSPQRQILSDSSGVGWAGWTSEGHDLLNWYARILAALGDGAHLLSSMIGVNSADG